MLFRIFFVSWLTHLALCIPAVHAKAIRYVAIGDSYTVATGIEEKDSWPSQLTQKLIASGLETSILRSALGKQIIIVTPGIRSSNHGSADDQKRVVTVRQAFENGCDYIVVGRPIRNASSPRAAAETIQEEITDAIQKIS